MSKNLPDINNNNPVLRNSQILMALNENFFTVLPCQYLKNLLMTKQ